MHDRRFVTSRSAVLAAVVASLLAASASPAVADRRAASAEKRAGGAELAPSQLPTVKSASAAVLDLRTGAVSGVECLVRWTDPVRGPVPPDRFIALAEETGDIRALSEWVLLRAVEDGRFLPVGADREVESRFRLLAGTNRDLRRAVAEGRFREDLLARLDLWTFALPGLAERPEDVAPNLDHELERVGRQAGRRVTMNREARERFLAFAKTAPWKRNFRDLGGAQNVVRMGGDAGHHHRRVVGQSADTQHGERGAVDTGPKWY